MEPPRWLRLELRGLVEGKSIITSCRVSAWGFCGQLHEVKGRGLVALCSFTCGKEGGQWALPGFRHKVLPGK